MRAEKGAGVCPQRQLRDLGNEVFVGAGEKFGSTEAGDAARDQAAPAEAALYAREL